MLHVPITSGASGIAGVHMHPLSGEGAGPVGVGLPSEHGISNFSHTCSLCCNGYVPAGKKGGGGAAWDTRWVGEDPQDLECME